MLRHRHSSNNEMDGEAKLVDNMEVSNANEHDKEVLEQLTDDLNRLDEQENEAKKSRIYDKNRAIFLMQSTLLGISYSIVWPTLWTYVRDDFKLRATVPLLKFVYGLAFVAYPIASILSAYIVERTTMSTKSVIMALGGFEILGNLLYALNFHPSLVIIGRFIAGLGDAFYVILMRDMKSKHGYTRNEAMTMECLAAFILGIILSPGINIITTFIPFTLLSWKVNSNNYPGLSTAVLFIIMELVVLFLLPAKFESEDSRAPANPDREDFSVVDGFREWGYRALFVGFYSFMYTYIVAFFEISIPIIIYQTLKVNDVGAMLLYAIVGTLYAMILMFGMTVSLKNQLEASIGVSVLAKTAGLFGVLYLGFSDKQLHKIICVAAVVLALTILWSNDDILFINLVRVIVPGAKREYTHNLRKTISKFAFGIAAITVPFCLSSDVYVYVGPVLVFSVYFCFCFFVVVRYVDHNTYKQLK